MISILISAAFGLIGIVGLSIFLDSHTMPQSRARIGALIYLGGLIGGILAAMLL